MSIYGTVVSVLSKPPENRPDNEVRLLIPWFSKKSELFRMVTKDVIMDIVKNCLFATVKRNNIIIRQGDRGDCFYMLLRGAVSIYINNTLADGDDEILVSGEQVSGEVDQESAAIDNELDRSKFGNLIAHFEEGKSFGELALLNKNCIRNASIISDEVCDLVVVQRDLYNRCLHDWQAAEFNERTNFVMNQVIFENWSFKHKKQMAMSIRKVKMNFDETIVRQGQPINTLYFLLRGQAKVMMEPAMHMNQYPEFFSSEVNKNDAEWKNNVDTFASPIPLQPSALRRRQLPKKLVEVCIIGINQIIGDVELSLDLKSSWQTVVCSQACELYALDMKNYERLVVKRNPRTVEVIRQAVLRKIQSRLKRHTSIRLPIFEHLYKKAKTLDDKKKKIAIHTMAASSRPVIDFMLAGDAGRGAIIDHYGPGTVYHRLLTREKQFADQKARTTYRGAGIIGGLGVVHQSLASQLKPLQPNDLPHSQHEIEPEIEKPADEIISPHRGIPLGSIFKDWNSSDRELTLLEDKLSAWHSIDVSSTAHTPASTHAMAVNQRSVPLSPAMLTGGVSKTPTSLRQQRGPNMVKLRRVTLQKGQTVKPGTTVVLRPRPHVTTSPSLEPQQPQDYEDECTPRKEPINPSSERKKECLDLPSLLRERTIPISQFSTIAEVQAEYKQAASLAKLPRLQVYRPKRNIFGMLNTGDKNKMAATDESHSNVTPMLSNVTPMLSNVTPMLSNATPMISNVTQMPSNRLSLPSNVSAGRPLRFPVITPTFQTEVEEQPERPRTDAEKKEKKRTYTAVEYQELRKTLLFRERSMGVYATG